MSPNSASIQVVVRLRPMNEMEKKHGTLPVIKAQTQEKSVTVIKNSQQGNRQASRSSYTFDNVFSAFSTQEEVFDATLKPMIRDVMQGYESTAFAYGQTGTGKTHTMEGNLSSPVEYGIIPRSAQAIFETLKKPEYSSYNVVCSYLEIYNEDLCDLLADESSSSSSNSTSYPGTPIKGGERRSAKLEIMNGKSGTFCRGLTQKPVHSTSDVHDLMQRAQQLRRIGETKMNKESSRSHCVFSIIINANKRLKDGNTLEFSGKLHLVDLAGSECAKSAGLDKSSCNEVARERERMNINRSLLTLGRVIQMLKEQSNSNKKSNNIRIPYRDSKLTRILQESLGGRCKTLIIATLSPSVTAIEESISTLNYAQTANGIVNKPVSSSYLSLSSSISSSVDTSGTLETGQPGTIEHWSEMECRLEYMQTQVEEAKAALARKHLQQQEFIERAETAEKDVLDLQNKNFEAQQQLTGLKIDIAKEREEKLIINKLLRQTEISLKKTNAILDATQHTEVCLTSEAEGILHSLEESIKDGNLLHQLLNEARNIDINKRKVTKTFQNKSMSMLGSMLSKLNNLSDMSQNHMESMVNHAAHRTVNQEQMLSSYSALIQEIKNNVDTLSETIRKQAQEDMIQITTEASLVVSKQVQDTKDSFQNAEKDLSHSFAETRDDLHKYGTQLSDMENKRLELSEQVLSTFESNIEAAKDKVSGMVLSVKDGLNGVRDAGSQTRTSLMSLLLDFGESSKASLSNIDELSKDQRKQISLGLDKFIDGTKYYEEMTEVLSDQTSFISSKGDAHLREMSNMKDMIFVQREAFKEAHQQQQHLQEEILSNVFKGMQSLMKNEMKRLSESNKHQFNSYESSSSNILTKTEFVSSNVSEIFQKVQDVNSILVKNVEMAQSNDDMLQDTVKESRSVFSKIEKVSKDQQSSMLSYVSKTEDCIDKLNDQDKIVARLGEKMTEDKRQILHQVSDSIFKTSRDGILTLSNSANRSIKYAENTIISNLNDAVNRMEAPRHSFHNKTTENLDQVEKHVIQAVTRIHPIIKEQCVNTKILQSTINEQSQNFNKLSDSSKKDAQICENLLVTSSKQFQTSSSDIISSCLSSVSNTNTTIRDFSSNDIQCDENVPPLSSRTSIEYNSALTSTPSAESILQGLDFSVSDESNDSISIKSDTSSQSSIRTSLTNDQPSSSDTSFKQSCLKISTVQNPIPLSEMSLNKENHEKGNSGKHSSAPKLHQGQTKKRSKSNQRGATPLRNRIPTTPSRQNKTKRRRERV